MGDAMEIVIRSSITVTHPTAALLRWCREDLTLDNPDYEKKLRLGYWTGNTPKTLALYEIRGDKLVLPYGAMAELMPFLQDASSVRSEFPGWPTIDFGGQEMSLYDYQESAVRALQMAKYGILQSPAGSGKTQMGIELIKRFRLPALWLTHTTDLLNQSRDRALRYIDPSLIGTITAGQVNIGKGITFATVQTLSKLDLSQYKDQWAVVIIDEVHHAAGCPTMMTRFYKVLNHLNAPYKFGLSATPHRADGLIRSVYALIGPIVHKVPDEAVKERILKVGISVIGTGSILTEDCLKPDGTLDYAGMINVLCIDEARNRLIVHEIVRHRDKPALILSERLDHLSHLMDMLPEDMRDASCIVTGKTKKDERDASLAAMRDGRKQYLFASYPLAKEGLDIPRLEALYMATPAKDETVIVQSLGRVARSCPGKEPPVAFDFVDMIPYCRRAYKERQRHYRRLGAYYLGG